MRVTVETEALVGLSTGVRDAARATRAVELPAPPPCEDVDAADAVGALLSVCAEQLVALSGALSTVAVLVDTARFDYVRVEATAVPPQ
jgi:hypothetical protein